jgi:EAL domain-containing protein (putative c-di-GMP-specific phosphodiesterase class I)
VVALGKSLGMKTLAEGVETQDQLDRLRQEGCDEVQGYLFSKPVSADAALQFARVPAAI